MKFDIKDMRVTSKRKPNVIRKVRKKSVITIRDVNKLKRWGRYDINAINKYWDGVEDLGRFVMDCKIRLGPYDGIKDAWKGQPAFIVGASAGAKGFNLNLLDGLNTIGINHMIEYYDKFKWFIFLDNRFLVRTTYDITNYKGKVFSSNSCMLLPSNDVVRFKKMATKTNSITLDITKGLYNGSMTGLCALHLALIAGADPIYLIGCDSIPLQSNGGSYHYKENYNGEIKTQLKQKKYDGATNYFKKFNKWNKRIVNVHNGPGLMTWFKTISTNQLTAKLAKLKDITKANKMPKVQVIGRDPIICHMITMGNMESMGDISRQVYNRSIGKHIYCNINNAPPFADIYLLECFINGHKKYINFQRPFKAAKIVSLIHSSGRCMPAIHSDKVITITNAWGNIIKQKGFNNVVIPAAIDVSKYNRKVDYSKQTFGRITRYSTGKVHPRWPNMAIEILNAHKDSKCIMYVDKFPKMNHPRLIVDSSIKINEHEKKAQKLSELTMFCDMHNTFVETFSLCLLEAMAAGLCIVLYSTAPQPAMKEILFDTGIICRSEAMFKEAIMDLLPNAKAKKEWGDAARERAKEYSIGRMIQKYNDVFNNLLK